MHISRFLPRLSRGLTAWGFFLAWVLPFVVFAQGIQNPIGCDDIGACILKVVNYVLGLAGVLALAGIVYGGFMYITAAGNQDRVESGKNAVMYAVIGLIVIGLSFAILRFIFSALGGSGGSSGGTV
ncbi:MAG: hypothetical protein Q8R32_03710 [bacterium]|nr:hypothetical protein [bacterium]